jgi:hypothetical protein
VQQGGYAGRTTIKQDNDMPLKSFLRKLSMKVMTDSFFLGKFVQKKSAIQTSLAVGRLIQSRPAIN